MKKNILLILILFSSIYSNSQCQKGDCKNEFSTFKYGDGSIYQGYFKNGKLDSLGFMFYSDKRVYQGELKGDKFHGSGYFKWKTGQIYIGGWEEGLQSGLGIEKSANGGIQSAGLWVKGKIPNPLSSTSPKNNPKNCTGNCVDGIGRLTFKDSTYVQGIFNNKQIVLGYINNGTYIFDGEIKKNKPHGFGQIKYLDTNEYFMGYFEDGKKNGVGIFTNKNNKKVLGKWVNNEYQDPTKFIYDDKDFCTELIALAKLTKKQRKELKVKNFNTFDEILEKQFLNTFEIKYQEGLSLFNDLDDIHITFPTSKNLATIKFDELKISCKECKKLKPTDYSHEFTYDNVNIKVKSSEIVITYPKPDPCISGNCKNGKGKKQFTTSVYEGQFKDGKMHGKGKENWENGNWHEGDYKNDKRNGNGTFFWNSSGNKYIGEFKDGFRNGQGTFYYKNGNIYSGTLVNNTFEGKGTFTWNQEENKGQKYEGEFKADLRDGFGTYTWANGSKYIGKSKKNKFEGYGKEYNKDGDLYYEGNFVDSKYEGQGTYYFNDGKYIGNWKEGKRNGEGKFYNKDGKLNYEGGYKDNKFHGNGTYYWKNGDKFIGEYIDGKKNGKGTTIWSDGYMLTGNLKGGKFNGQCKEYRKDGSLAFEGEYIDGNANGYGKLYNKDGKLTFEGQFKDGKKVE